MKIIYDTENDLEYLEMDTPTSSIIDNKSSLIQQTLENYIIDIKKVEYHDLIDRTTNEANRVKLSFPIGTIFCTLYNLSVIETDDLDELLSAIAKKKITDMNSYELLTFYFLECFEKENINIDLAQRDTRKSESSDRKLDIRNTKSFKMIPNNFSSFSKSDKLLLIKLFNPLFSIEDNIQTNSSNYMLNFFYIISYFLLSFCVSYLYHENKSLIRSQNIEIKIDDIHFLFLEAL